MVSNSSKESLHRLFLLFFWLLYFLPLTVIHFEPRTEYIALIIRMPVFFVAFFSAAGNIIKMHMKKNTFLVFLSIMLIWNLFCILINTPSNILSYLSGAYQIVELVVVLFYSFSLHGINGLRPLYHVSIIYVLLNFIVMMIYPYGIYISDAASSVERAEWLFGSKNNVCVYLAIFSFLIILMRTSKSFLSNLLTLLLVGISCYCISSSGSNSVAFGEGSSTGIIMCLLIIFTAFFSNKRLFFSGKHPLLSPNRVIVITLVVNIVVLSGFTISFFNNIIVSTLHKNVTFSGRVYVWKAAIEYIKQSPIWGHGITNVVFWGGTLTSTYNFFLGIMKNYGVLSALILLMSIHSLKYSASRNVQIVLMGFLTCIINGLMSQVNLNFIVFFITLVYLLNESEMNALTGDDIT